MEFISTRNSGSTAASAKARSVERMTLFAAELGQRQGYFPRMNWRLLGEAWTMGKADSVKQLIARD